MREINLELIKKDTKTYTIHVAHQNGATADISGWVVNFSIKTDFNDLDINAKLLKSFTIPNNIESTLGICYLHLTSVETNLDIGEYYYDMKFITTNYRETFCRGKITVVPTIKLA